MNYPYRIIYEDNHLLVVNKPAGLLVQGDKTGDPTILDLYRKYIKEKYSKPGNVYLEAAHRLDRPVSGVVMLAKTSKAISRLTRLFRDHETDKRYFAISDRFPQPDRGTWKHFLIKDPLKNKVTAFIKPRENGKEAITHYQVISRKGKHSLIALQPLTGRSHQLRSQMAAGGCPVLGDLKYNGTASGDQTSIYLHAFSLKIQHPVKKEPVEFRAPLPDSSQWRSFTEEISSM